MQTARTKSPSGKVQSCSVQVQSVHYYLGFGHSNAVVPHVELLVHLYSFIDGILQTQDYTSTSQQPKQ